MRRGAIGVLLLLASCAPSGPGSQTQPGLYDDRELVVLTAPPGDALIERAVERGYVLKSIHQLDALDDILIAFEIPEGRTIAEAIDEVEALSPGATAGAHHLYQIQSEGADWSSRSYANSLIRWPPEGCRAVGKIGMIDSGVMPDNPGLSLGRIVQQRFVDGDAPPATDHGSLTAELLVGPGRLTNTTLLSANVVEPTRQNGDVSGVVAILRAINWLESESVDVVNISLAGPRNKLLNRGLGKVAAGGMVLVASAGNQGPEAPPQYPAAFPFVLAVTAVDQNREVYDKAIQGDHIDFAAPGVDLLLMPEGRLRVVSGTSVAAPFVAATIAADPRLSGKSAAAIRERLSEASDDLGQPGKDVVFGAGLIQTPDACDSD